MIPAQQVPREAEMRWLRAIEGFQGQPTTKAALQLLAMLASRPGELRHATWAEFDLDGGVWNIPACASPTAFHFLRGVWPFCATCIRSRGAALRGLSFPDCAL